MPPLTRFLPGPPARKREPAPGSLQACSLSVYLHLRAKAFLPKPRSDHVTPRSDHRTPRSDHGTPRSDHGTPRSDLAQYPSMALQGPLHPALLSLPRFLDPSCARTLQIPASSCLLMLPGPGHTPHTSEGPFLPFLTWRPGHHSQTQTRSPLPWLPFMQNRGWLAPCFPLMRR